MARRCPVPEANPSNPSASSRSASFISTKAILYAESCRKGCTIMLSTVDARILGKMCDRQELTL